MTREEIVRGYQQVEHWRDRHGPPVDGLQHRVLGDGLIEERRYELGRLVETRRFTLGAAAVVKRSPRWLGGSRIA